MGKWQRIQFQPGVGIGPEGSRVTACEVHRTLSKEAAKEGMVLLKNEGEVLPLAEGSRIALFGKGTFDYVKGGGGSGDVTVSYITNLYEGFCKIGWGGHIHKETAEYYENWVEKQYESGIDPGMTKEPELPEDLCRRAAAFADTAVISLCRFQERDGTERVSTMSEWMSRLLSLPAIRPWLLPERKRLFLRGIFTLRRKKKR